MSEDKSGKAKITIEVELNEALMGAVKDWRPRMGSWGGMGPWKGHGVWGQMHGGMGGRTQCPACGAPMASKEQVLEMLQHRKEFLEAVLEHINVEIKKIEETKKEEKSP